ncbi:MBL fold metallo-hydrolase [Acetobacter sacchari]|uniref:MBL fold metallo-hydrolase n=1 Tax=Acetobacter sacchari TaxID=2661687 RepID=A0ABS3LY53_9PROT|nr:MBL fold metallo-hydrolase [Acetobacter sacchari]MBO1360844.1 MBL fold metallo-hydrolase [Acetobacter sacchari]
MKYLEPTPEYGRPIVESEGLTRIVARNPGPMTYHGTNTWLIDTPEGKVVLDPGPDDPEHLRAVLDACGGGTPAIFVTHWHHDHEAGAATLAQMSGATVYGGAHGLDVDAFHTPGLRLVKTPGHSMDHVCLDIGGGRLLSGDHIMGWSTTVVPRSPHGDMRLYLDSLQSVLSAGYEAIFSAHGPTITEPEGFVQGLIRARQRKIQQTRGILTREWRSEEELRDELYGAMPDKLRRASAEMLGAMLDELELRGEAERGDRGWRVR